MFSINKIPDDRKTWELFKSGKTVGCFQLEKPYTGEWCHKVQPDKILDLADILSIIRPGTTKAIEDGKSMTQHYVDRKHGQEPVEYIVPELEAVLKDTWAVLTYQEQAMQIAMLLAGFTEQQADMLRKAIGHKDTQIMSKLENEFLAGVEKTGRISVEQGKAIFEVIRKSQRYSFNKSHAAGYAITSYKTGYCKTNWTIEFFCVYLQFAKERLDPYDEVRVLVNDAKDFGIEVLGPYLPDLQSEFYIKDEKIHFGLSNIKGIGESQVLALQKLFDGVNILDLTLEQLMVQYMIKLNKTVAQSLVAAGALDYLILRDRNLSRRGIMHYLGTLVELTPGEKKWLQNFCDYTQSMATNLKRLSLPKKDGGGAANQLRQATVKNIARIYDNPPYKLVDNPEDIALTERHLLGVSITCHVTESYDAFEVTDFCQDIRNTKKQTFNLGVSVAKVSEMVVKKGASAGMPMAFLSVDDKTGSINDLVIFSDAYAVYKNLLVEGNVVGISGFRSKKNSLIVQKVWEL